MPELLYIANMRLPSQKAHSVHVMEMCAALAAQGRTVFLLVPTRRTDVSAADVHAYYGVPRTFTIMRCRSFDAFRFSWLPRRLAFVLHALTFARSVQAEVRRHPADILILSRDAFIAARLARRHRRVAFEVHDLPGRRAARFLRAIPNIIATNRLKRDRLVSEFGIPAARILVAPNAVDAARFRVPTGGGARFRAALGMTDDRQKLILYTGHLYAWKGVETLARAAARLAGGGAPAHAVVFVGGGDDEQQSFRRFLDREKLGRHVRVLPHRPHADMPDVLAAADLLVLPTSAADRMGAIETSPLKAFEYAASGKPIVAADLPSSREVFGDGMDPAGGRRFAWYFRPDDPADCARAITEALGADGGGVGPSALRDWTWEKRAKNILEFIQV